MLVGYKSSERYVLKKCSKCNAFNSFRCLYSAENKEQKRKNGLTDPGLPGSGLSGIIKAEHKSEENDKGEHNGKP